MAALKDSIYGGFSPFQGSEIRMDKSIKYYTKNKYYEYGFYSYS